MKERLNKNHWLTTLPIAHRGLWGENINENSLSAYKKAVEFGFPIEIDLFLSNDEEIYSIHDKNLFRLTGLNKSITELEKSEIEKLKILGGEDKIPTLKEVLDIINGKVPVLIEIKNQENKNAVNLIMNALKNYKGEYAVQSFNPLYIKKVKEIAPEVLRGILTTRDKNELKNEKFINKLVVKYMPLNFLCKPDFISAEKNMKIKSKLTKLCWTIQNKKEYEKVKDKCDNIIFENFIP